jgi:hypothetical protein
MNINEIEIKIIMTSLIFALIAGSAAYPDLQFAKWGEKKFGSYENFIMVLMLIFGTPILITVLYCIWSIE